jgi:hypothetical protein
MNKTQKDFLNEPTNIFFLGGSPRCKSMATPQVSWWSMDEWYLIEQSKWFKTKSKQPRMVKVVSK